MKDWQVRALKTFVQCFGGVLVPEIVLILNNLPADIDTIWKILFPIICSAVAAGIAAVWNIILEELQKNNKDNEQEEIIIPYQGVKWSAEDYDKDSSRDKE